MGVFKRYKVLGKDGEVVKTIIANTPNVFVPKPWEKLVRAKDYKK